MSKLWEDIYTQVLTALRLMYQKAKLVHADLSEWNILYHKDSIVVIDTAQAVESEHPNALLFLRRDCNNVANFFRKRGIRSGLTTRQIFSFVTDSSASLESETGQDLFLSNLRRENTGKSAKELTDEEQVAEAVFMSSFIPRTLRQVPNPIGEIEQMQAGADVSAILHATVTGVGIDGFFKPDGSYKIVGHQDDGEDDEEVGEDDSSSSNEEDNASMKTELKPRKTMTKEEKKQQRREVKAKRREARLNKNK